MVLIPLPDNDRYCIDERQATYGEYRQFIKKMGKKFDGQPSECSWNRDYGPSEYYLSTTGVMSKREPSLAEADPDHAVNHLDFCDAWAFCSWAGKRLCGERGDDPRRIRMFDRDPNDHLGLRTYDWVMPGLNEWLYVCTQGGTSSYPYGEDWKDGVCLDHWKLRAEGPSALRVRDTAGNECRGTHPPYDRVFNMIGGVRQWTNICSSTDGRCQQWGAIDRDWATHCDSAFVMYNMRSATGGVRCCADAVPGYSDRR